MAEPLIATIQIFAGGFAPRDWAYCEGQLIAIQDWSAVFSLVSTLYGGDGRSSFALPDLRGRSVLGTGHGPGRTNRVLGQSGGNEYVTLNFLEMPSHNHTATNAVTGSGGDITVTQPTVTVNANAQDSQTTQASPTNNYWSAQSNFGSVKPYAATADTTMALGAITLSPITASLDDLAIDVTTAIGNTGGSQSHENMHPWLALNYIIAMEGVYPSRT